MATPTHGPAAEAPPAATAAATAVPAQPIRAPPVRGVCRPTSAGRVEYIPPGRVTGYGVTTVTGPVVSCPAVPATSGARTDTTSLSSSANHRCSGFSPPGRAVVV